MTKKDFVTNLSDDEDKVLKYYHRLNDEHKDYVKGEMVRLYMAEKAKNQDAESSEEIAT